MDVSHRKPGELMPPDLFDSGVNTVQEDTSPAKVTKSTIPFKCKLCTRKSTCMMYKLQKHKLKCQKKVLNYCRFLFNFFICFRDIPVEILVLLKCSEFTVDFPVMTNTNSITCDKCGLLLSVSFFFFCLSIFLEHFYDR